MEQKSKPIFFWVVNILIALVVLIFIIQNRGPVEFNFLGLKLTGYGFLVFLVIFLLGFFTGWMWSYFRGRKKRHEEKRQEKMHRLEE